VKVNNIQRVLVIGAGIMGEGIAQTFAQAGLQVRLIDLDKETLSKCLVQIRKNVQQFIELGLIMDEPDCVTARIEGRQTEDIAGAVKGCDYVIEAVPEILKLKKEILTRIMSANSQISVASNTSSFTIDELVEGVMYPERVIGLHYFNPAHIIPLVEIHRGRQTAEVVYQETLKLMQQSGKQTVLVRKEVPGFIVNRITAAIEREIDYLLDEGIVSPEDLDIAIKSSIGFRFACLGPMEVEDMIGLDTAMRVSQRMFKVLSNAAEPSPELVVKVKRGELGIKSGKGWYDYRSQTRENVLEEKNRVLLQQLKLYQSRARE
jgi:3-hydroxybutyryl-CoA dehydrogenase